MSNQNDTQIHQRRKSRNIIVGLILAGFVCVVFSVTVVKLSSGQMIEGFDHAPRSSILVDDDG